MTHLAGGVDKLEADLLKSRSLGVHQQRLPQRDDALLRSNAASLDHDKVIVDFSVVRESSHGCDRLVRQIILRRSIVLDQLQFQKKFLCKHPSNTFPESSFLNFRSGLSFILKHESDNFFGSKESSCDLKES